MRNIVVLEIWPSSIFTGRCFASFHHYLRAGTVQEQSLKTPGRHFFIRDGYVFHARSSSTSISHRGPYSCNLVIYCPLDAKPRHKGCSPFVNGVARNHAASLPGSPRRRGASIPYRCPYSSQGSSNVWRCRLLSQIMENKGIKAPSSP
jgi:hypothetical protein